MVRDYVRGWKPNGFRGVLYMYVCVCSHRVSGVLDNSTQRKGRESLPPQTLMSSLISCRHSTRKTRQGGKKHVLLNEQPLFWLEAFLITCRIVIAPIGIVWASNSSKLGRLLYFSNVFPRLILRMIWENITFQNKWALILKLFSVSFVKHTVLDESR